MGKRALPVLVVVVVAGWTGAARAQEPVEPLPPAQKAVAPEGSRSVIPPAPEVRDVEAPQLRFEPPPLGTPAAGGSLAEPGTMQMVIGVVAGVAVSIASIQTYASTHNPWYTGAVAVGGALGTGAIVCAVGQLSPTRRGGCRGSLVGALVGVVGAVPGLLLLHLVATSKCSGTDEQQDGCLSGQVVGGVASITAAAAGYTLGTAYGAQTGWKMGAVSRGGSPMTATASVLSVQF